MMIARKGYFLRQSVAYRFKIKKGVHHRLQNNEQALGIGM